MTTMVSVAIEELPNETLCRICKEAGAVANDALTVLLKRNEPMIGRLANELAFKGYASRLFDYDDLMQVGRIAMIEAAKRYDPNKNNKFSTYAWTYVSGIMRNEATANSSIVSASRETILRAKQKDGEEERQKYLNTFEPLSLNQLRYLDARDELTDTLESDDSTNRYMNEVVTREILADVAKTLTENERYVVFNYFGIGDGKFPKTEEEVARELNLTRQRVQQLKKSGIKKMAEEMKANGYVISDFIQG